MNSLYNHDDAADYDVSFRGKGDNSSSRDSKSRRPVARRRGKAPTQFNGIHRRRNKKIRW